MEGWRDGWREGGMVKADSVKITQDICPALPPSFPPYISTHSFIPSDLHLLLHICCH